LAERPEPRSALAAVTELPDVGHYLQIEGPARIAKLVDDLARSTESGA
jgi:pimeloyl-ACP methyl ester carboxylesterase